MIKQLRPVYPLPFLRGVFKVSPSSYYAWQNRKPSKRAKEDARLEVEIKAAHKSGQRKPVVLSACKRIWQSTEYTLEYAA